MPKIYRKLSKHHFDFPAKLPIKDLKNLFYLKTIKFAAFSDLDNNYDLISEVLARQNVPSEMLISIGKEPPKFGIHFSDFSDKAVINELLNSVNFFFCFEKGDLTLPYIVASILSGSIPILNKKSWYDKIYGFTDFYCGETAIEISEKISFFLKNPSFWRCKVARLSEKFRNKVRKL